jgi:hypothetical protein
MRPEGSDTLRGVKILLGLAIAIPGAYMGIAGGWLSGYLLLFMGALVSGIALLSNTKRLESRQLMLDSHLRSYMFKGIPGYRMRFYALLMGLFCMGVLYAVADDLYDGWIDGQLHVFTGPKGHRVKETVVYDLQPWRFRFAVAGDIFMMLVFGVGLVHMGRCLVLGKRALK